MHSNSSDIARALAEASRTMNVPRSLEDVLDAIVQTAVRSVPGFDHVGISVVHKDGRIQTMSGTDQLVWELDELQYELGEGPCVDAIAIAPVVLVERARDDPRWPRYMPEAVRRGLRAQLGLRLYVDDQTLGGLNLYSTRSETIDRDAVHLAELFATHAAIALGRSRSEDHLNEAIASRKVIGQAIGIISERYEITGDRAFQFLVRASQSANLKLRLIAQDVVDSTDEKHGGAQA